MLVSELIEILKKYPQDAHVAIERGRNTNWYQILESDMYLEELQFVDEWTDTYWDYCEHSPMNAEDWVWWPMVQCLMFRE